MWEGYTMANVLTKREELQVFFETLCKNVYFEPPSNIIMDYPAIEYRYDQTIPTYADDMKYINKWVFSGSVMSRSSIDPLFAIIEELPNVTIDRMGSIDKINHVYFTIIIT